MKTLTTPADNLVGASSKAYGIPRSPKRPSNKGHRDTVRNPPEKIACDVIRRALLFQWKSAQIGNAS